MTHVLTRTHVIAPKALIKEVDRLVGPRRRSQFITDAVAERVEQKNRIRAVRHAMNYQLLKSLAGRPPKWSHNGSLTYGQTQIPKTCPKTYEVPS